MKKCSSCGVKKPLSDFNKHKNRKDGHQTACKPCNKSYVSAHYYKNQSKIAEQNKQKYPEKRTQHLKRGKEYYNANKAQAFAKAAKRRATKLQRTPKWVKSNFLNDIKLMYKRAQLIKNFTGELWHVDHIVPLQGELVSGLHVPWNLQLLPAKENLSKANKFRPE